MNQISDVKAFFLELLNRFGSKSPQFFTVIKWVMGAAVAITGIPAVVDHLNTGYHLSIVLPLWFEGLKSDAISLVAIGSYITAQLTTQRTVVPGGDTKGVIEGATHSDLPFTAKKEEQSIVNADEPKQA